MANPGAHHGTRVLIVEDGAAVALMYKLQLELNGYLVEAAPVRPLVLSSGRNSRGYR